MRRGLFLDLDGTLADSHAMLRAVYERVREGLAGGEGPGFDVAAAYTLPAIVERLGADRSAVERRQWLDRYQAWVLEGYADVPARDGAHELMHWARGRGYTLAVVTSAAREDARRWLEHAGLLADLDLVVGREDVAHPKPAPDPYTTAVARTDCALEASTALEDSPSGATSAVAAGLRTFVLGAPGDRAWPAVEGHVDSLLGLREHLA